MGHWMKDVNGDDYYIGDKGYWITDVNGDDHYTDNRDHWLTRLYFGKDNYLEVDVPIEVIINKIEQGINKIEQGYTWFRFTATSTKSTCLVNIKTVQYITEYPE